MTRQIAVIGECMVELRRAGQGLLAQGFGGDTLNTALYLARLGSQALAVHYVTALGQDGFSSQMLAAWQQEGIHTDWVQRLANTILAQPGPVVIAAHSLGCIATLILSR